MTAYDIDAFAKNGQEPEGIDIVELGLFHRLNAVYRAFDANKITVGKARKAKIDALEEYEAIRRVQRLYVEDNRRYTEIGLIMSDANKNGCPICQKISRIYGGRSKS